LTFDTARSGVIAETVQYLVYQRKSGAVTETFQLRKSDPRKSTEAELTFLYAGGIVTRRSEVTASGQAEGAGAYTYGFQSPTSAIPASGTATYLVELQGALAGSSGVSATEGGGRLQIDYAAGTVSGSGNIWTKVPLPHPGAAPYDFKDARTWHTQATLSSGTNGITGGFALDDMSHLSNGSINGRFYGPNLEELGATWKWTDSSNGDSFLGTMLGRDRNGVLPSNPLNALASDESFATEAVQYDYIYKPGSGEYLGDVSDLGARSLGFQYFAFNQTFGFFPSVGTIKLDPTMKSAASDSIFDVYNFKVQPSALGPERPLEVRMLRPEASNPKIALTYTSFVQWNAGPGVPAGSLAGADVTEGLIAFGRATLRGAMPLSGSARYDGLIEGFTSVPKGSGTQSPYLIEGTLSMNYNFETANFAGSMMPLATDRISGKQYDLGAYGFSGLSLPGATTFQGNFTRNFAIPGLGSSNQNIFGEFTGPKAEEFFGSWRAGMLDPVNGDILPMQGIAVAKQAP
jgi:hypothetical protein